MLVGRRARQRRAGSAASCRDTINIPVFLGASLPLIEPGMEATFEQAIHTTTRA